ncbi:MAG: hypothetical protein U5R46_09795 [Gammaproteobacteria bacterium]|nr:hypothetical protein [Gammaproteobacteria bacterium]
MRLVDRFIRRAARSQTTLPWKDRIGKMLKETYYNAEVLYRIEDKTAPLNITLDGGAEKRINLLIPEINYNSLYGGYMAKFNLARKLVERGYRVRLVVVDPSVYSPESWRDALRGYQGLEDIFNRVEVAYQGDRRETLAVGSGDRFIATTWWTAYLAHHAREINGGPPFVYLIQEYEPFTFPMGSYFAMAEHSYSFPHKALFSSRLLKDFFRNRGIGVFDDRNEGGASSAHFENAIVSYDAAEVDAALTRSNAGTPDGKRKLLFYARPEAHATRNMFEVAFLALVRAIEGGVFDGDWEFHGIGSGHGNIDLPRGNTLRMLGKFGLAEYREALLRYDVGLSLMYTPHPSLLPLDMASAGVVVVTNTCMNKTVDELKGLSTNLIGALPHIAGVRDGLELARERADDIQARRDGARVNWAGDWDDCFHGEILAQMDDWLG